MRRLFDGVDTGLTQDPLAERHDQATLLGQRNELVRLIDLNFRQSVSRGAGIAANGEARSTTNHSP